MSLGKKIFLLISLLVALIAYSVYEFDYNTVLNSNSQTAKVSNKDSGLMNSLGEKFTDLKSGIMDKIGSFGGDSKSVKESVSFELVKQDNLVTMNGIFKNEAQAKKIGDMLNINREGDYKYNANIKADDELLNKISSLVSPLKNYFANDSKIQLENGKVKLDGKLADPKFKGLVESKLASLGLDVQTNFTNASIASKAEEKPEVEKKVEEKKEVAKKPELEQIEKEVAFTDKKSIAIVKQNSAKDEKNSSNGKTKLSQKANEIQVKINELLKSKKITFKRRSTSITSSSMETVKDIAKILKENANLKVEIAGHTDSRGRASLNKRISQDRANSVKKVLVKLGVNNKSLKAVGYGEDFPIAKDDKDGLSEINRRVEFNIIGE